MNVYFLFPTTHYGECLLCDPVRECVWSSIMNLWTLTQKSVFDQILARKAGWPLKPRKYCWTEDLEAGFSRISLPWAGGGSGLEGEVQT